MIREYLRGARASDRGNSVGTARGGVVAAAGRGLAATRDKTSRVSITNDDKQEKKNKIITIIYLRTCIQEDIYI